MEAIEKIDFEKVGKRMKKLRKEQRISQDQVAKDLGSTISFVSNIENNNVVTTALFLRFITFSLLTDTFILTAFSLLS